MGSVIGDGDAAVLRIGGHGDGDLQIERLAPRPVIPAFSTPHKLLTPGHDRDSTAYEEAWGRIRDALVPVRITSHAKVGEVELHPDLMPCFLSETIHIPLRRPGGITAGIAVAVAASARQHPRLRIRLARVPQKHL